MIEILKKIVEESSDLVCTLDAEGKILWTSKASKKILGYNPSKLKGKKYSEFIQEADLKKWEKATTNVVSRGKPVNCEIRHIHKEGHEVQLHCSLFWDSADKKFFCIGKKTTEVTEAKKGAKSSEEQQNELKQKKLLADIRDDAIELAKIGGWEIDLITNTVYWSPMTKKLYEVDHDFEPNLDSGINFYREDVRDSVKKHVDVATKSGEPWDYELPIITAKGRERWIKSIGKVEYKNNTPIRIVGSFQDIHDRKIAELRLQNTADNIPGAIFQYILYPDGTDAISYLTKGAEELWDYTADQCMENIDLIWNQIREGGDIDKVAKSIRRSAEKMEPWHCQYRSRLPGGKLLWHEGHGKPRKQPDGSIIWDSLIIDITDQKKMESLLTRASEMAKIGSWEMDLRQEGSEKMYWSPMTRRILEVDESYDPRLSKGFEFYNDESRDEIQKAVDRLIKSGKSFDLELQINTKKRSEKWIRCIGEAEYGNKKLIKIFGSFQDITNRKTAELAAQEALLERNTILESISDAFFAVDWEWKVTYWNRKAEELMDKDSSEIVGKNLWDVYAHAVGLELYTKFHQAVDTGKSIFFESYYPAADMWFEISAYPSDSGLSVYFKNVTLRKKSSEKLRQSNERFENVAKATNDAIYDWDIVNNDLFLGEGFNVLFGHDIKNPNHSVEYWIEQIHPDDKDKAMDGFNSVLQHKKGVNLYSEYRYLKSDGTYAYVINRGMVIRDDSGVAQRIVGAVTDISQRKDYEESLQELNENLEQHAKELAISNSELEQFAFVTSHDLQEPLRMISSFLTQLERKYGDQLDEKAHQYIFYAVDGAKRMRQIILDLLDFSTIGKSVDLKESIDINEVVNETCQLQRKAIEETGAIIIKENLPTIKAQRTVVAQIFQNLIGNALKYRKDEVPPEIVVSATEKKEEWIFSIKDNGIGIEEEYFDKIFNIFQKLHSKDKYDGTGMGLAIVKKSVENLGGKIWVESTSGVGSNFNFSIKK